MAVCKVVSLANSSGKFVATDAMLKSSSRVRS